ncbi:signal transduction histidine kinase [Owenweeksia hongkongensis DSM 17368]|uniref:histidine kinase n=1 Tax=Owenweeksia hongkongensis (strain DSM 17368 / CIP 108786 / JCM 12287 / NRRL B-23963 / UST20020801) TaxID=926562 RepID=G8R4G2_OWEHD|nr:sensor histidine kinase [Owenweeksia hongkongensis]AEV32051.1 signal transduction histidine kinase [Owenweeksia hongkongensis DSM 17368]
MKFRKFQIIFLVLFGSLASVYSQTPYQLDSTMVVVRDGDDDWFTKERKYRELLFIAEQKGYTLQQTYLLRFIGDCANELTDYKRAIQLYKKALVLAESNGYDYSCEAIVVNIAAPYTYLEEYDSALFWYNRAFCEAYPDDTNALVKNYYNQSLLFSNMEDEERAEEYIDKLLELQTNEEVEEFVASALRRKYLMDYERDRNSEVFSKLKGLIGFYPRKNIVEVYNSVADLYREEGIYDSALVYYNLTLRYADTLNDQFYMIGANEQIAELNSILHVQNKKKETWIWGLSGALAGVVALLMLVWRTIQQKRKIAYQKLQIKNQQVNELLKDQEIASTQAMLEGQDNERRRIAEELHDTLGSMLATVKLHFGHVEDVIDTGSSRGREQYIKAEVLLNEACGEVRRISHDLYSGVLMKFGLKAALEQLQETLSDSAGLQVQFITSGLTGRLPYESEMNLYRVVQELVSNTIKYSGATKITLQIGQQEDELNLMYEDNGKGFDLSKVKRGMGLDNIENRVKRLSGKLHIDSTPGYGMTVIIEIPIDHDKSTTSG